MNIKNMAIATTVALFSVAATAPANAYTYLKYEILTAGSGMTFSGYGNYAHNDVGFFFTIPIDSPLIATSTSNSMTFQSSINLIGYRPGSAVAKWSPSNLGLQDVSSDHNFSASVCAPQGVQFSGYTAASFGVAGCDATVSLTMQSYRGAITYYSGKIVEFRSQIVEGTNEPLGYMGMGAVPEPTTWAMMLVGLGMVAGAARYRRRATHVAYG